jgi:GDP-4-dehydro-6-deoxy-D-mannose reductase
MTVLVTGAGGFIGRWLTTAIERSGYQVIGVDRENANILDALAISNIVRDAAPSVAIHLAAQSSVSRSFDSPMETFETNVIGTVSLLEAIRRYAPHARTIIASSAEVYGRVDPQMVPIDESAPLRPVSPYAASKASAEMIALHYHQAFKLDIQVVRSFNTIGPMQPTSFALPTFASQLARIAKGKAEPVLRVGNLAAERDFLDVRDAVRAYIALAAKGATGKVFNICSGTGISIGRALEMLIDISGLSVTVRVSSERMRPVDVPILVGCSDRLRFATGWTPEIELRSTLADLYQYHFAAEG